MTTIFGVEGFPPPARIYQSYNGTGTILRWDKTNRNRFVEIIPIYPSILVRVTKMSTVDWDDLDYFQTRKEAAEHALEILKEWGMA